MLQAVQCLALLLSASLAVQATAADPQLPQPQPKPASTQQEAVELNLLGCLQMQGGIESRARDYFERAAPDLPAARFNLGLMLVRGQGGDVQASRGRTAIEAAWREASLPEAGAWLLESALGRRDIKAARAVAERLQGIEHPRSDLVVARLRFAEGRHEQALMLTNRAARAGQAQAARLLAMLERSGTGLPRDAMESASWQLIAEAMLSPVRPTDSVFHAAVKNSMQANDWTPQGPVSVDNLLACGPLRPGLTAVAAAAAAGEPATPAGATGTAPSMPPAPAPAVVAPTPTVAASAPSATPATPRPGQLLPTFELATGQRLREAWIAYGQRVGTPTLWVGPDVAARTASQTQPESLESLGLLIVESAQAVGLRLKLQIQENEAGAIQALRIVPATD